MSQNRSQRGMLLGGALILLPGAILLLLLLAPGNPGPTRLPADSAPVRANPSQRSPTEASTARPNPPASGNGSFEKSSESPSLAGLRCRLTDAASGLPIPDAPGAYILRGERKLGSELNRSDSSGWVTLRSPEPALYSLQVKVDGFVPQSRAVLIKPSITTEVVLRLEKGETIVVEVTDSAGAAIPGVEVRAFFKGGGDPDSVRARPEDDNTFRLQYLRRGLWGVIAAADGYRTAAADVELPFSDSLHLVLREDPGFGVLVTDASGLPIEGARVAVRQRTHGLRSLAGASYTDAQGKARLRGLPGIAADPVVIETKRKGFLDWSQTTPAGVLEGSLLHIALSRGLEIKGHVLDESGKPVSGAEVRLSGGSRPASLSIKTSSTGEFLLRDLAPASYTASASTTLAGSSDAISIDLRSAGSNEDLTLTLRAGPAVIAGRVVDPDGRPVLLAPVRLGTADARGREPLRTVSDEDGRFRFAGIATDDTGTTWVVTAGGGKTARSSRKVSLGDESVELVTPSLGSLTGFLTGDSAPTAFEIRLEPEDGSPGLARAFRFSSSNGWFKLKSLEPGRYRLSAAAQGEVLATVEAVEARAGEDVGPIEVELP